MKPRKNNVVKIGLIAIAVFCLVFAVVSITRNLGKPDNADHTQTASKKLDSLYSKLLVSRLTPKLDPDYIMVDENEAQISVLPDISEYQFVVNPTTDNFITIYASTEKTPWLAEVAHRFNQSNPTTDGHTVSVGIRSVPSSIGAEFIASGKYTPDLYAPSSDVYGNMLQSRNVAITLVEQRIAGNITGVVLTKKKSEELTKKYGTLSTQALIESVLNGELSLGYTTPLSDEDGFSFILMLLSSFDGSNPLSDSAIASLRSFQDRVPLIAYDNDQLKTSLTGGAMEAIVLNYQTYANSPGLKSSYDFMPLDARQDNPVYEIGSLSSTKKQTIAQFVEFCLSAESQQAATDKGFNQMEDHPGSSTLNGTTILQVQEIYKREKNGSSDLTAVFVADISGSMEGSPLLNLKASLNHAIGVINSEVNVGMVTFSDNVNIAVPIARFDNTQKSYFSYAVNSMIANGGTAMYDAVVVAQKMLMDAKALNPNTKIMLFVLTDGETNRGYELKDIESITRDLRIPVYTIGYNADIDALKQLSDINEAATMNADSDNVIHRIESLFNAQM